MKRSVMEAVAVFGTLMLIVLVLAFMLPTPAHGEMVFTNPRGTLKIHDWPCPASISIAAHTQPGTRGYYRAADAVINGEHFKACAAPVHVNERPGVFVHVVYEDGEVDFIPQKDFKDDEDGT